MEKMTLCSAMATTIKGRSCAGRIANSLRAKLHATGNLGRILVVTAAACMSLPAGAGQVDKSHPAWMVGKWARVGAAERVRPEDCPEPEFYGRNGYVTYAEVGGADKWWIEGDRLVRKVIEPMAGGSPTEVGRVFKQRFTRMRSGDLVFKDNHSTQRLVRCGSVPPNWTYRPRR